MKDILLVGLAQSLVGLLGLLLEQLKASLEGLVLGVVLSTVAGSVLGLLEVGLQLLHLRLEDLVAVGEGCDLLFLGQVLLLKALDLILELLNLCLGLIRLQAESVHFLQGTCRQYAVTVMCKRDPDGRGMMPVQAAAGVATPPIRGMHSLP